MPYQTSGRGIRALQSQADLLGTMPRRHIESALQMATYLRLSNIVQFMRGQRIAEVTDLESKEERAVYIGQSMAEIEAEFGMRASVEPQTGLELRDGNGQAMALTDPMTQEDANIIILTDELGRSVDLTRIKFELDTGKERNRAERQEFAEMVMQNIGAPAVPWALELLDAPNKDTLINSIEESNAAMRIMGMVEEAAKASGVDPQQILQQFQAQLQQLVQGAQNVRQSQAQNGRQGPPQGQSPPQGPPQGPPQAPVPR